MSLGQFPPLDEVLELDELLEELLDELELELDVLFDDEDELELALSQIPRSSHAYVQAQPDGGVYGPPTLHQPPTLHSYR